ncbi:hypothetical protein WOLCODRAFT_167057 [Wolfiporia cocos MD-104 SS10]|uniref:RNA exonuclease 4 n=1 Tax=Wolfiporia cocos (strain MD-104) TaxID=742152 RepID=A0A2H3JA33_WOLCO|nr:hypothetical protein WOLCODRAFT_167057 [Wolfiporia cocos MD-104 SS10]
MSNQQPTPKAALTKASTQKPSSNWLTLKTTLPSSKKTTDPPRKRRKVSHSSVSPAPSTASAYAPTETSFARGAIREAGAAAPSSAVSAPASDMRNGESLSALRKMISGELEYSSSHQQPGKYLALDCEMVGVGPEGSESSLARVSLVNFYGAVQLDVFVQQRERVADYRTQYSGIRPSDMVNARPFAEVQKQVADLIKDRILVGHAVHNDFKALLLSLPHHQTRDTQIYAYKHKVTRSRRIALRNLVKQELGISIQGGEHSSVTDARATMAVYRLHRKEWEKGQRPDRTHHLTASTSKSASIATATATEEIVATTESTAIKKKRKRASAEPEEFPGGGRKGISSGLSIITKRRDAGGRGKTASGSGASQKQSWWKSLGDGPSKTKGSLSLKMAR